MPAGVDRWSFATGDAERIEGLLHSFLREADARCALLVDRTGQLVSLVGERPRFDSAAFASLAAADFSANDQLAALLGEQDFASLFHQGEKESMYLADVARRVILVVIFDQRATLGMVRIKVRGVVRELSGIFGEIFARAAETRAPRLETRWADEAEHEIDRLFGSF